ncbi:MAG: hypothetical protein Q4A11_06005 [Brachymonas sp.]|nr:hypothetical protein [Brachymonas sp.]
MEAQWAGGLAVDKIKAPAEGLCFTRIGKKSVHGAAGSAMQRFAFGVFAYDAAQLLQILFAERAFLKKLGAFAVAVLLRGNAGTHVLLQRVV